MGTTSRHYGEIKILRIVGSVCPRIFVLRSFWNLDFLVCLDQSATTKMTAWTVGSCHGFVNKTGFLSKALPKKESGLFYDFSSYCIIDFFLCKGIISRLFVME